MPYAPEGATEEEEEEEKEEDEEEDTSLGRCKKSSKGRKLKERHQLLVYTDYVSVLEENKTT
jgi:hypothetical protein